MYVSSPAVASVLFRLDFSKALCVCTAEAFNDNMQLLCSFDTSVHALKQLFNAQWCRVNERKSVRFLAVLDSTRAERCVCCIALCGLRHPSQ
jgi:hypothetical protein